MDDEPSRTVGVPDSLPLELWYEIVGHAVGHGDDGLHLIIPWLAVAPLSVARHMHDAAFPIVFQSVRMVIGHGSADDALKYLSRILERNEECVQAVRSIDVWARADIMAYDAKIAEQLAVALGNALPRFPMLEKFSWDYEFLPIPISLLRMILADSTRLEGLGIGRINPGPVVPQIKLAVTPQLIHLYILDYAPGDASSGTLLHHSRLEFLHLHRVDNPTASDTLTRNASSLREVTLGGMNIGSVFLHTPYTVLETIRLQSVSPPSGTGLDFSSISTLKTLSLRRVGGLVNIGFLDGCIRTPKTLQNLRLSDVSSPLPGINFLSGVNIPTLDSLDLTNVPLSGQDIISIFSPRIEDASDPVCARLTKLKIHDGYTVPFLPEVLTSSHCLPSLRELEIKISNPDNAHHWYLPRPTCGNAARFLPSG
ncbi:hypothetical protein C8R44DRAFT_845159 [Mycena epipterygia]|nr:hypothetical protein C8R44DRAFT_845159 [Mycena epipterygia]